MNIQERNERIRARRASARALADAKERKGMDFQELVQEVLPGGLVVEVRNSIPNEQSPGVIKATVKVLRNGQTHVWVGYGTDSHAARMNAAYNNSEQLGGQFGPDKPISRADRPPDL